MVSLRKAFFFGIVVKRRFRTASPCWRFTSTLQYSTKTCRHALNMSMRRKNCERDHLAVWKEQVCSSFRNWHRPPDNLYKTPKKCPSNIEKNVEIRVDFTLNTSNWCHLFMPNERTAFLCLWDQMSCWWHLSAYTTAQEVFWACRVGQDPSDSKSSWLHVYIFRFWCFHSFEVHSIDSSKMMGNSPEVSNFTGYFSNSTGSSVTNRRFFPDIGAHVCRGFKV